MDALTWFGLAAVSAMLVTYANEHRGPGWVLGFAASCLAGSAYGFLQGAWPFGVVEAVWSLVALRRWRAAVVGGGVITPYVLLLSDPNDHPEDRVSTTAASLPK